MHVFRYATAAEFLTRSEPWLSRAEAENNLVLGIARRYRDAEVEAGSSHYWATVESDREVVGCAFRVPPHRIAITHLPVEAVPLLVEDVSRFYDTLPGVGGPAADAERFAQTWAERFGLTWNVHARLRIHALRQVRVPPDPPAGELRRAVSADAPLIRRWMDGFVRETEIVDDPDELADRLLRSERAYVWDHRGPRCLVAATRDTPTGVSINAVFTPVEDRRRGYASIAVAALSRQLLDTGYEFCCLYTDLANPTPNSIYARLGYEPVQDCIDVDFSGTG